MDKTVNFKADILGHDGINLNFCNSQLEIGLMQVAEFAFKNMAHFTYGTKTMIF